MIEYSSNLVIVWMVFEVYLHFAIYWYDYNFFINIVFNHLISISKWDFFLQSYSLGFELLYSKYYLQKNVSILACRSSNTCSFVTTIFDHCNVLSPKKGLITFITSSRIFLCKRQIFASIKSNISGLVESSNNNWNSISILKVMAIVNASNNNQWPLLWFIT